MKSFYFCLLALGVLVLVGCKAKKMTTESDPENTVSAPLDQRLHDIWVLLSINGEQLDRTQARPQLELFPGESRMAGNGSCNELFGQMEGQGDEVTFKNIGTTKKFCRDLMALEDSFLTQLQAVNTYRIKDLKLYLLDGKQELLVFQKVD